MQTPELRPDYIEKIKNIEQGKFKEYSSVKELRDEIEKEVKKDVEELADDLGVIEACEKFEKMGYFKKKRMIDVSQIMK